jgi:hypothetical protein
MIFISRALYGSTCMTVSHMHARCYLPIGSMSGWISRETLAMYNINPLLGNNLDIRYFSFQSLFLSSLSSCPLCKNLGRVASPPPHHWWSLGPGYQQDASIAMSDLGGCCNGGLTCATQQTINDMSCFMCAPRQRHCECGITESLLVFSFN